MDKVSIPCSKCNMEESFTLEEASIFKKENRYVCKDCKSKECNKSIDELKVNAKVKTLESNDELENKILQLENAIESLMVSDSSRVPITTLQNQSLGINNVLDSGINNLITSPQPNPQKIIGQSNIKQSIKNIVVIFEDGTIKYEDDKQWLEEKDWIKLKLNDDVTFVVNYKVDPVFVFRELKKYNKITAIITGILEPSILIYETNNISNNKYNLHMNEERTKFIKVEEFNEMGRRIVIWDTSIIKKMKEETVKKSKWKWWQKEV